MGHLHPTNEQEPEIKGYFSLPGRIYERDGVQYSVNYSVLFSDKDIDTPPHSDLRIHTLRISVPATLNGERVGWWSGVYEPPVPGDSDYLDPMDGIPFGD